MQGPNPGLHMLVNTSNYNEGVQKTMTNITKRSLVAAGVLAALMAGNVALAADVPAGVTLAEKQTLVRNNGADVQSEQDTDCRLRGSG